MSTQLICEVCECEKDESFFLGVLYPDGQALNIYCKDCITQPQNGLAKKKGYRYFDLKEVPFPK